MEWLPEDLRGSEGVIGLRKPADLCPSLQTLWQQLPPESRNLMATVFVHGLADPEVVAVWEMAAASALVLWGQDARQGE